MELKVFNWFICLYAMFIVAFKFMLLFKCFESVRIVDNKDIYNVNENIFK